MNEQKQKRNKFIQKGQQQQINQLNQQTNKQYYGNKEQDKLTTKQKNQPLCQNQQQWIECEEKGEFEKIEQPQMELPTQQKEKTLRSIEEAKSISKTNLENLSTDEYEQFSDNKKNSSVICVEDSEVIPVVNLQTSEKGQKFVNVKIPMYRTNTFMKMETQMFLIEIAKPGTELYQIQRRYSDFLELYEGLFYNQPGFILAPFPEKGFESFLKIKFGIATSEPGERCQIIEKRRADLEKFANFVTHHPQLSNSEEIANFITFDIEQYEKGKQRLEKYVSENQSFEKASNFTNLIEKGKSILSGLLKREQQPKESYISIGKNDIQFVTIFETVKSQKEKAVQNYKLWEQLRKVQNSLSEFVELPFLNDLALKLCAKHKSGKDSCRNFAGFLEVIVLGEYQYIIKRFEQIEKALSHRMQMWQCYEQAKKVGNLVKKSKLSRRLHMFQTNFLIDWESAFLDIKKKMISIHQKFTKQWSQHKKSMKKIWNASNSI